MHQRGGEERVLEKEEEDEDDEDEDDEDEVSEGSEVPEGDRPAGPQHHQLNGERGPQSAKERVKEWTPCGPHQGQDEGRGPAPGSGTRQVFSMAAMNKEGGSGKDPSGGGEWLVGTNRAPRQNHRHLFFISQPLLPLGQTPHPPCLCPQENQPCLGLMGPPVAVRKLQCLRRGVGGGGAAQVCVTEPRERQYSTGFLCSNAVPGARRSRLILWSGR